MSVDSRGRWEHLYGRPPGCRRRPVAFAGDGGVHRVRVTRDEDDPRGWLAEWVADDRVHTFARSLAELGSRGGDRRWSSVDVDGPPGAIVEPPGGHV